MRDTGPKFTGGQETMAEAVAAMLADMRRAGIDPAKAWDEGWFWVAPEQQHLLPQDLRGRPHPFAHLLRPGDGPAMGPLG